MIDWLRSLLRFRENARLRRVYEAALSSNYRPRRGNDSSADTVMDSAKNRLREYGRWLDENHDIATGVLDDLVANIVGTGVTVEPMARTTAGKPVAAVNDQLAMLWSAWWRRPEVTNEIPGPELERLIVRTWLRDGEVFVQHVSKRTARYPTAIPYRLEPLEGDFVPFDLFSTKDGVTHGVQKDAWGQPIGYHVYKTHPGDMLRGLDLATKFVPAESMTHLKFSRRLHQTRGVSLFHSVFTRLDDLKDYEESERVAARMAAAFAGFIRKGADYNPELSTAGLRELEMRPGIIFDELLPGEEVGTISHDRPNTNLHQFRNAMLRAVAAGTGTRYSAIAKAYAEGTYSSNRQELVEGAVHYRRLFSYLVDQFYRPVWERFIDHARLAGALKLSPGLDLPSLYAPEFRPPALPWIDPAKEIAAHAQAVEAGFRSRYQVIKDLGGNPREVDQQLAADDFDVRPTEPEESAESAPDDADEAPKEKAA
jgi:lambda family phage portal protein